MLPAIVVSFNKIIKFETKIFLDLIYLNIGHEHDFLTPLYSGYTESHYKGLVELYHRFKDSTPVGFTILAFPCNQFGEQE